jgi:CubicO group peptidase (beta-lactamase class C family)
LVAGGPHVYPELSAAGLWTTPSDLARYAIGIQRALEGRSHQVISKSTARLMLTPAFNQQAIGLIVGGSTARKFFNHGGINEGYRCLLVAYEDGDGAVVMPLPYGFAPTLIPGLSTDLRVPTASRQDELQRSGAMAIT